VEIAMLDVTLAFSSAAVATGDLTVRRCELRDAISALFELTVEVLSPDPAIDEQAVVGQEVTVSLHAEPFVKEVRGIVRAMEQRTAVPSGASLYVWTIVPPLWLTTQREDCRIFQNTSVPDIVSAVLAGPGYAGRIPAPVRTLAAEAPAREYVVQYGESDWAFLSRILADEGIAGYFDHTNGSVWVLVDDTPALAPDGAAEAIPFSDPAHLNPIVAGKPDVPHVQTAAIRSCVETSAVALRDFDFEKPDLVLEAKKEAGADPLEAYAFEVGKFADQPVGDTRAQRRLDAYRGTRRRIACTGNFAMVAGARMSLVDHPRADLAGSFLVVRAHTVLEAGKEGTHELELMDLAQPFRPPLLPKPRIHGTQTALVVGAEGQEIDVDKHGRVVVAFRWDRRDPRSGEPTRRVRVAQGWAGTDRGFVMLPRIKDEVIVAYLDGDPDQPIIVGRVHNGVSAAPLSLPADKAISVWRSRSTPGGAGYNEILMDDAAGAERLSMHAQRDFGEVIGRNATAVVGNDEERTVNGNQTTTIKGNQTISVSGSKRQGVVGGWSINAQDITVNAKKITSDAEDMDVGAGHMVLRSDGTIEIVATRILLQTSGSTIDMTAGEIVMNAPMIKLNP
jgi:type VI secretion system secreted protein VgrG